MDPAITLEIRASLSEVKESHVEIQTRSGILLPAESSRRAAQRRRKSHRLSRAGSINRFTVRQFSPVRRAVSALFSPVSTCTCVT